MPMTTEEATAKFKELCELPEYKSINQDLDKLEKFHDRIENEPFMNNEKEQKILAEAAVFKRVFIEKYGNQLSEQLEGFLAGPASSDEADVFEWITKHYIAAKFFTSSQLLGNPVESPFFELSNAAAQNKNISSLAKWFFWKHPAFYNTMGADVPDKKFQKSGNNYEKEIENFRKAAKEEFELFSEGDNEQLKRLRSAILNFENSKNGPNNEPKSETELAADAFEREFGLMKSERDKYYAENRDNFADRGIMNLTDADKERREDAKRFWDKFKKDLPKELAILNAGPKGKDPGSMLEWYRSFPRIAKRGSFLLNTNGAAYSRELLSMAESWYDAFSDPKARRILSVGGNIDSAKIKSATISSLNSFGKIYDSWVKSKEASAQEVKSEDQKAEPKQSAPGVNTEDPKAEQTVFNATDNLSYFREVRDQIVKCAAELGRTESIWSSDSEEFRQMRDRLFELRDKLQADRADAAYTVEKLLSDFTGTLKAFGKYSETHKNIALSSRQTSRLKVMNDVQSVYENLRTRHARKVENPDSFHGIGSFDLTASCDKICLTRLKAFGTKYYRTALTDRSYFNQMRRQLMSDLTFESDRRNYGIADLAQMSEAELLEKNYNNFNEAVMEKYLPAAPAREAGEAAAERVFTDAELKVLLAVNKQEINAYVGNPETVKPLYKNFTDSIKAGNLLVFDADGKLAEPEKALSCLAEKIVRGDEYPDFFTLEEKDGAQVYQGQGFTLEERNDGLAVKGYAAQEGKTIRPDFFRICSEIARDVADMQIDLEAARSSRHGSQHKEMEKALNSIYKEFGKVRIDKCDPKQLAEAFSKAAKAANTYIEFRGTKDSNNKKQCQRLLVAQKIAAISKLLKDPELTCVKYLKTMYAQKVYNSNLLDKQEIDDYYLTSTERYTDARDKAVDPATISDDEATLRKVLRGRDALSLRVKASKAVEKANEYKNDLELKNAMEKIELGEELDKARYVNFYRMFKDEYGDNIGETWRKSLLDKADKVKTGYNSRSGTSEKGLGYKADEYNDLYDSVSFDYMMEDAETRLKENAKKFADKLRNGLSDEELVDNWPQLSIAIDCYWHMNKTKWKQKKGPQYLNDDVELLIKSENGLNKRMERLAKGHIASKDPEQVKSGQIKTDLLIK